MGGCKAEAVGLSAAEKVLVAKGICGSGVVGEVSRLVASVFGAARVGGAYRAVSLPRVLAGSSLTAVLGAIVVRRLPLTPAPFARRGTRHVES